MNQKLEISRSGRLKSNELFIFFVDNDGNGVRYTTNPHTIIDTDDGRRKVRQGLKVSVQGEKYIGIQQDKYELIIQNLSASLIAKHISEGLFNIVVSVKDIYADGEPNIPVFSGQIVNVVGGWKNFHTYESKFTCLRKASIFLNSLVNPYSPSSSLNYYNVIADLIPASDRNNIPEELKNYTLDRDDFYISGDRKTVLNDIIDMLNERVKEFAWYDITYKPEGGINIFNVMSNNLIKYYLQGETGLIGVPQLGDNGLTFEHVFQKWIAPGQIVHVDNRVLDTSSITSAYVYTIDPNYEYIITQVTYNFESLSGQTFKCTCQAFPRSKYNNWSIK